jgi:hypothetical protein
MQVVDLETRVSRLEKENHNLSSRVQKLESQRRSSFPVFVANVILLVSAGLLAGYLGFFRFLPLRIERLPLQAGRVQAQEFVLEDQGGIPHARLTLTTDGFQLLDRQGTTIYSKP